MGAQIAAGGCGIGEEVAGQERVEIEDGVTVESDLVGIPDQEFDPVHAPTWAGSYRTTGCPFGQDESRRYRCDTPRYAAAWR